MADPIVGIDLGTTNSVVALCDPQGQPRVLADERGTKIHPSVVSFHPNGSVVVLEGPRLQWFALHPSRWSVALSLFLHVWLAAAACAAIALGVAAWTSPGTAFLAAAAVPAIAWLEDRAPLFWPGVGLRDALELSGAGFAPGYPALGTWIRCAIALCAAPVLQALARDLWRREP